MFLFVRQVHVFQAKTREVSTSSKCLPDVFQENMGVFQRLFKPMPCCQQGYGYRLEDMDASCVIRWKTLGAKRRRRFTGLVSACMAYLLGCLRPSLRHAVSMGNNSGTKASTKNPCCKTLGIQLKSGVLAQSFYHACHSLAHHFQCLVIPCARSICRPRIKHTFQPSAARGISSALAASPHQQDYLVAVTTTW